MQVLPTTIAEFANHKRYHEFLLENHCLIADLLRRSGLRNLRALKYSLLVLEVAFDSLHNSTRHKSGVAMRFPRISRIRIDKPAAEADRVETLAAMVT